MQWIGETVEAAPISGSLDAEPAHPFGRDLLAALQALQDGDFSVRIGDGGPIAVAFNAVAAANQRLSLQLQRALEDVGGRDGARSRLRLGLPGGWRSTEDRINALLEGLVWPAGVARVAAAVTAGELTQTAPVQAAMVEKESRPLGGEFAHAADALSAMVRQLGLFASEVSNEVSKVAALQAGGGAAKPGADPPGIDPSGIDGPGGVDVPGAAGSWQDLTGGINRLLAAARDRAAQAAAARGGLKETAALRETVALLVRRVACAEAALERSNRLLQESEDSRRLALAAGTMGSWDWDVAAGHCLWDDRQKQIFGADPVSFEVTPGAIRALVEPGDFRRLCRQLRRARRNGGAWQLEFRVRRPDGAVRWCYGMAVAVRDAAGRTSRIRGITMDITDRKEAEDRQALLAREVDHRTKNALAVVHAIVSLTRAADIDQFSAAVEGRIQALARAHSLLSEARWRGAKIAELILGELATRSADPVRVRVSGRSLSLHPAAVQALALAIHELAANAERHGALSVPSGGVHVAWEQQGDELALRWIEFGLPAPLTPPAEGFGLRIVRASIETQLCGTVAFDWHPDGLRCLLRVPCRPQAELFGSFLYSIQTPGGALRRPLTARSPG